jgi:hypothetical protein
MIVNSLEVFVFEPSRPACFPTTLVTQEEYIFTLHLRHSLLALVLLKREEQSSKTVVVRNPR